MARVLVADPIAESAVEKMKSAGLEIVIRDKEKDGPLEEQIKGFDCIIVRSATKVTREVINAADSLRLIVRAGVGLDNVDQEAAKEKGIKVMNTPEAPSVSVAEMVFAHMFALSRNITQADASMKSERWEKKKLKGIELWNKTLGIIGFGRIGMEVARRAKAFGMTILYTSRSDTEAKRMAERETGAKRVDLDTLLRSSDFVSIHVSLTDETRHLIDRSKLALMKPTAFIINTARGGVIDEKALIKALDEGKIAGAGLDVFETEPPDDWTLVKHPKVVATPHIASSTVEAQARVGDLTAEKVIKELT